MYFFGAHFGAHCCDQGSASMTHRSDAFRSIAAQVTGSGQELAIAAESCLGELANFWKRSLRENWCQMIFRMRMTGRPVALVE